MTNSEIIKKHYKDGIPPINYPTFLRFKDGRGKNSTTKFHSFETGENYDTIEDVAALGDCIVVCKESEDDRVETYGNHKVYIRNTKQSDWTTVSYDVVEFEGVKFLAIYILSLDCRSTFSAADEKRKWEVLARCYISSDKTLYYGNAFAWCYRGTEWAGHDAKGTYPKYPWHDLKNINNMNADYYWADRQRKEVFAKMGWAAVTLGNNRRSTLDSGWEILDFLKYKEPSKKNGPKQKHIDELVALEIEEVHVPKMKEISDKLDAWKRREALEALSFANISAVSNGDTPTCCYRTFVRLEDGGYSEGARIYIEPDGKFTACKKNNFGEWVNISLSCDNSNFGYKVNYINKKAIKGTVLEYLIPMLTEIKGKEMGAVISASLRHPCIEKLYKAGFSKFVIDSAKSSYGNIWDSIESKLGKINEKGKTIYALIGVSKNQLAVMEEIFQPKINNEIIKADGGYISLLKTLKKCFSSDILCDIDINTFRDMVQLIADCYEFEEQMESVGIIDSKGELHKDTHWNKSNWIGTLCSSMQIISSCFPIATTRSMIPKVGWLFKQYFETPCRRYKWELREYVEAVEITRPISTYLSYLQMMSKLPERTGLSPHFQSVEHVKIMHDDILPVHNYYLQLEIAKMNEVRHQEILEKWDSCKKTWAKWEFDNGEYAVIMPDEPYKLTVEGTSLGHCVGGYIERVVKRTTNIMFIRKAEALDKPFFTVEILTDGTIEQIHGMRNCNIADPEVVKNEPNLVKFVNEWVKEKKLALHNINKVR